MKTLSQLFAAVTFLFACSASAAVLLDGAQPGEAAPASGYRWTKTPETHLFGSFKRKSIVFFSGKPEATSGCFPDPNRKDSFRLTGRYRGDDVKVCFGGYEYTGGSGSDRFGYAVCVLKAVAPYAENCNGVDIDLCIDDASIAPVE